MSAKTRYSRTDLIAICERAIVAEGKWSDRDSARAQIGVGTVWALLKAGCAFRILASGLTPTDEDTIWLRIRYRGFQAFEWGDEAMDDDLFYLPTPARLDAHDGRDWYR